MTNLVNMILFEICLYHHDQMILDTLGTLMLAIYPWTPSLNVRQLDSDHKHYQDMYNRLLGPAMSTR